MTLRHCVLPNTHSKTDRRRLGYWTTRGYANSRTVNSRSGRLADWTTRVLDKSRTGQFADATGDFACLIFVLLAASARTRVVQSASWQSASWRMRELSSYRLSHCTTPCSSLLQLCGHATELLLDKT